MNDVKFPIKTIKEGNKITKICVEDIYKTLNRIIRPLEKTRDICDEADKDYEDCEGSLIIGVGRSQPCMRDAFDEEIGNNLAFIKAKLNANLKKRKLIIRVWKQLVETLMATEKEIDKVEELIEMDIDGVRKHNPEYMLDYKPFFYETNDEEED